MGRGMRAGKKPKTKAPGMGGANMQKQLQQVQAMQRQMETMQAEIEEKEITTTAGGGAVSVTANGKREIVNLTIDKEVVDPEDIEMLQDLVISAINEAVNQVETTTEAEMSKITGGVSLPGLF